MSRRDDGAITLHVVIMVIALMAAFGLVVDVGTATAAKGRAIHNAYAAARAGAEALSSPTFVTTGRIAVDPVAARQAALAYLQRAGDAEGATVTVSGSTVTVHVRQVEHPHILSAFGLNTITVSGEGSASAVYGLQGNTP